MLKMIIVGTAIALLGCGNEMPKPLGQLYYKISGAPGTPVLVEYYGTAVRPGDRRFARDLIVREVTLPREGFVRFWGAAEADGIAMMRVLNKDPSMKKCVELAIQIDERSIKQAEACLKSYTTELSATVPSAKA
ncbi:MAG: hypothetical protein AB7I35_12175 [Ramlibacter sp.]